MIAGRRFAVNPSTALQVLTALTLVANVGAQSANEPRRPPPLGEAGAMVKPGSGPNPPAVASSHYLGCFVAPPGKPTQPLPSSARLEPQACVRWCAQQELRYAVLASGGRCACSADAPNTTVSKRCKPCGSTPSKTADNKAEKSKDGKNGAEHSNANFCGHGNAEAVYEFAGWRSAFPLQPDDLPPVRKGQTVKAPDPITPPQKASAPAR
jgi:hypothetical protein